MATARGGPVTLQRAACLVLLLVQPVMATGLTVDEAERLALSRENFQALQLGQLGAAQGELTTASTWPNPKISASQEEIDFADSTSRERSYWLTQRIDVSGERGLRRDAANANLRVQQSGNAAARLTLRARLREYFYQALYWQRREQALSRSHGRLQESLRVLRRQEEAGETARYDVLRLERSVAEFETRLAEARAGGQRSRARLAALIDRDLQARELQGELIPPPPSPMEELAGGIEETPRLAHLKAQAEASDLTARAARRGAIPDITLGIGHKEVRQDGQTFDGDQVSLGLSIPLFDRNQGERATAQARARIARSEYALARAELRGELQGHWQQLAALRASALAFEQANQASADALIRAAESGYHGDEIGVLELVDAYQNAMNADLRLLELQWQAREAHTELLSLTSGDDDA